MPPEALPWTAQPCSTSCPGRECDLHRPNKQSSGVAGSLRTCNSGGRSGSFYLPSGYPGQVLPVALLLHGSGDSGRVVLEVFRNLAERRSFIIIAPDSSNPEGWGGDLAHIQACEEEVRSMPGVCFPPLGTAYLIAGFSGGAMYCPLLGFRHQRFSAQALLHGHLQPTCFLPPAANAPHVWLSTGSRDTLVPPHVLHEAAERVQAGAQELSSSSLTVRLDYDAAHEVTPLGEDVVDWWLAGAGSLHRHCAAEQ